MKATVQVEAVPESRSMSSEAMLALQEGIKAAIPLEQKSSLELVVAHGIRALQDEKIAAMLTEEIESADPVDKKLAGAAAGLMVLLNRKSRGAIYPEIYIPAGAILLLDMAQTMLKRGFVVEAQDVRDGIDQLSALVTTHAATAGRNASSKDSSNLPIWLQMQPQHQTPGAMQ